MNRRDFLNTSAGALTVAGLHGTAAAESGPRPNILFCLADDWGWPHAGAYGDPVVKTPTFDRLAREGVLFEHAFVSSPSCTPCRNSILTGQAFYRLGRGANLWSTLDAGIPTFMRLLEGAGYSTGHWRKAWGPGNFRLGGYEKDPCGPTYKGFGDFLQKRPKDKPFCFWFGTSDPHRPYKAGTGKDSGMDLNAVHVPGFYPDNETIRSDIADYYFEVQRWDTDVGKALALLEESDELDNTVVVMSGDHGMPFPRCKGNLYDWGARVPLAVRWGKGIAKPGRRVTDFVSLPDLAPTFLELAGVPVPDAMTGRSLLPVLRSNKEGRVDSARDHVVIGRERHTPAQAPPSMAGYPSRAIRTDAWLFIMNLAPDRWPAGVPGKSTRGPEYSDCDGGPIKSFLVDHTADPAHRRFYELSFARRPGEELYDVNADPYQVHNLAADPKHAATVRALRGQLTAHLRDTDDPRFGGGDVRFDEYPYVGRMGNAGKK